MREDNHIMDLVIAIFVLFLALLCLTSFLPVG